MVCMLLTIIGNNVDEVYVVRIFIVKLGFNYPLCCVVPGSWSVTLALKAKLTCGGAVGVSLFRVWLTWRRAPCLVRFLLQLCPLESCIPVCHTVCNSLLIG